MARTPDSSAFAKGQLMQAVKAGEDAQEALATEEVTNAERKDLTRVIKQAEYAKETLRELDVKI